MARVTVDNVNAIDQGTALLHGTFVKVYSVLRIVILSAIFLYGIISSVLIIRREGFVFTIKWGVIASLTLWSICLLIEYSIFAHHAVTIGFPYSTLFTSLTVSLHWGSFLLGYWAFSLMLLAWANIVKSINISQSGLIKFMRTYMPYVTIIGTVLNTIAIIALLIVIIFNLPNIPQFTTGSAMVVFINLVVQVVGYTYYCARIIQTTRIAVGTSTNSEQKKIMNKKLTMLALTVIFGWILLGLSLIIQNYVAGIASYLGFWAYNAMQDVCFFFVILTTFVSLNMRTTGYGSSNGGGSSSLSMNKSATGVRSSNV
ncbi:hypothetical protein HDV05_008299 [Chytridiales sp. JEL 0842]|nr:hypothetical protein HDV05_008299 [Chytridiales sp. JEL 0842]